jgi:hypothetical protein
VKAQGLTLSEGLALMEEAFPFVLNAFYEFFGAALAEARFDAGRVTDALALVDRAVNTGEGPASGLYAPEVHRLRGTFLKSLVPAAERGGVPHVLGMTVWWSQFQELLLSASPRSSAVTSARKRSRGAE